MTEITPIAIDMNNFARLSVNDAVSVFRYPGGKGFLAGFLQDQIAKRFGKKLPTLIEPFCGGAGASLNLLKQGAVKNIVLNDADTRIYSAWRAIITESDKFKCSIEKASVDIDTWNRCLDLVYNCTPGEYSFDLGFATFFINRTSRSGVILGSGPIGGYGQNGKWKIDVRFNKERLKEKVTEISRLGDSIRLENLDAIAFAKSLKNESDPEATLMFIDPPYVDAGGRLYLNAMNNAKHLMLAKLLKSKAFPHWILTYDDHQLVRESYSGIQPYHLVVNYSLQKKRLENELLYMSDY